MIDILHSPPKKGLLCLYAIIGSPQNVNRPFAIHHLHLDAI
jgi:hypothetical protein